MQIYSITDKGKVRTANQDAFFAGKINDDTVIAVVCDGMGGAAAGNIASETAVKHISDYIIKSFRPKMNANDIEKTLKNAIKSANIELYDMSVKSAELTGMGTTVVLAVVKDDTAVIAHVGDSRIYLLNDQIKQLTRDHSVVQSLVESGKITPEDAKVHPRKNVITRALGAEEKVFVDTELIPLTSGDTLLLCTDGLNNFVEDSNILEIYKKADISAVPEKLVEAANLNGGGDNITVVTLVC